MGIVSRRERKVLKEKMERQEREGEGVSAARKTRMKYIACALIIILAALIIGYLSMTGFFAERVDYSSFVSCLGERAVMYTIDNCRQCELQEKDFGTYFRHLKVFNCGADNCSDIGLNTYPTWLINNVSYIGRQPVEILGFLTGCEM